MPAKHILRVLVTGLSVSRLELVTFDHAVRTINQLRQPCWQMLTINLYFHKRVGLDLRLSNLLNTCASSNGQVSNYCEGTVKFVSIHLMLQKPYVTIDEAVHSIGQSSCFLHFKSILTNCWLKEHGKSAHYCEG